MIHVCERCGNRRDCLCGDCGEKKEEICTKCNNIVTDYVILRYKIPKTELGLDVLGGWHIKKSNIEKYKIDKSLLIFGWWK